MTLYEMQHAALQFAEGQRLVPPAPRDMFRLAQAGGEAGADEETNTGEETAAEEKCEIAGTAEESAAAKKARRESRPQTKHSARPEKGRKAEGEKRKHAHGNRTYRRQHAAGGSDTE